MKAVDFRPGGYSKFVDCEAHPAPRLLCLMLRREASSLVTRFRRHQVCGTQHRHVSVIEPRIVRVSLSVEIGGTMVVVLGATIRDMATLSPDSGAAGPPRAELTL